MDAIIYTLEYPLGNIRYVGITKQKTSTRLYNHIYEAKKTNSTTHKLNWIRTLLSNDSLPIINIIDIVDYDSRDFWETYWIHQLKNWGFNLTNSNNGGAAGWAWTKEMRELHSKKMTGRKLGKWTPERIQYFKECIKNRKQPPCSEEKKLKLSEKFKGRTYSVDVIYNMTIANRERAKKYEVWNKGKKTGPNPDHSKRLKELYSNERSPFYGKKHTEETKQKMRDRNVSQSTKDKISFALKGKKRGKYKKQNKQG